MERLLEAGALDVTLESLLMKKNRPGTLVRVIAKPEDREALAQLMFAETSTLGLRIYSAERRVKERHTLEVESRTARSGLKSLRTDRTRLNTKTAGSSRARPAFP